MDQTLAPTLSEPRQPADQLLKSGLLRNRLILSGLFILLPIFVAALLSPVLSRHQVLREPQAQFSQGLDDDGMPLRPNQNFFLGTDNLGRDVFSRVVHGARVSLTVGTAAMLTATAIGVVMGLLAGFHGGKLDLGLMRFTEMNMTLPAVMLAVAFAGVMDGRALHLHPRALAPLAAPL